MTSGKEKYDMTKKRAWDSIYLSFRFAKIFFLYFLVIIAVVVFDTVYLFDEEKLNQAYPPLMQVAPHMFTGSGCVPTGGSLGLILLIPTIFNLIIVSVPWMLGMHLH